MKKSFSIILVLSLVMSFAVSLSGFGTRAAATTKIDFSSFYTSAQLTNKTDATRMIGWDAGNDIITVSSSIEAQWVGGTGKGYLLDGQVGNVAITGRPTNVGFYLANSGDGKATIIVNLQKLYAVDKFTFDTIYTGTALLGGNIGFPTAFTISTSKTGVNWTTVKTETNYQFVDNQKSYEIPFALTDAKYIKFDVTAIAAPIIGYTGAGNDLCLTEIGIYGTDPIDPNNTGDEDVEGNEYVKVGMGGKLDMKGMLKDVNLSEPKTSVPKWDQNGQFVKTSESFEADWGTKGIGKGFLVDGVTASGVWPINIGYSIIGATVTADNLGIENINRTSAVNEWIEINLQSKFILNKLGFAGAYASGNGGIPTDFTFDISNDGQNWTTVLTKTNYNQTGIVNEFAITPVEAQYIRLNVTKIATAAGDNGIFGYAALLTEMIAYGDVPGTDVEGYNKYVKIGTDGKFDLTEMLEGKAGKTQIPGWDTDGAFIKTSKSLEAGWGNGGIGKGFMIDGTAGDNSWPINAGYFVAANLASNNVDIIDLNNSPAINEWVEVNLQSKFIVNKFGFAGAYTAGNNGIPTDFTIDVSKDGVSWTTVVTKTDYSQTGIWNEFSFPNTEAQYIRLNVTKCSSLAGDPVGTSSMFKYTMLLTELSIYGKINVAEENGGDNNNVNNPYVQVKAGGKLDMSGMLQGKSGKFDVPGWDPEGKFIKTSKSLEAGWGTDGIGKGFLVDGVIATGNWPINVGYFVGANLAQNGIDVVDLNNSSSINEWIEINLQSKFKLNKFGFATTFKTNAGAPTDFTIQTSLDGENWTTVKTVKGYNASTTNFLNEFSFEPTDAQYIKLNVTKCAEKAGDNGMFKYTMELSELTVYSATDAAGNPVTSDNMAVIPLIGMILFAVSLMSLVILRKNRA